MQLNQEAVIGTPRPAASIIILRDAEPGLEVFLMKRHDLSNAFGGAYVFPGGKVDAVDAEPIMAAFLDRPWATLQPTLNEDDTDAPTAGGLYVAALREVFEECGILFARHASDAPAQHGLYGSGHATAELVSAAATRLQAGDTFNAVVQGLQLQLLTSSLVPWSRWITPVTPTLTNKRFDTRFFVAAVPSSQTAVHDNHEATDSAWLRPRDALTQYRDGSIMLAAPQIMTLAHLSRFATVDAALQDARSRKPPLIQPEPFDVEDARVVCYPGDERHPVKERAMPGPTRLYFRNKRFSPLDGFDSYFA